MQSIETELVNYFQNDKFKTAQPLYLSVKNISRALKLKRRLVYRILGKSDKFEQVSPLCIGSNKHSSNLAVYKLV